MTSANRPLIMSVEDNPDTQQLIERLLDRAGYDVIIADNGVKGLETLILSQDRPDLILLDVMMPEMNGYEFSAKLQENKDLAYIPVVFLTALGEEQDKAKAFAVGAVDYLTKPIMKDKLLQSIQKHLQTKSRWKQFEEQSKKIRPSDLMLFKNFLNDELKLTFDQREKIANVPASQLYSISIDLAIATSQIAKLIAKFLSLPYHPSITPGDVQLGVLPAPFCRANNVVAIKNPMDQVVFVVSNPFNLELLDHLSAFTGEDQLSKLIITEPENVSAIFKAGAMAGKPGAGAGAGQATMLDIEEELRKRFEEEAATTAISEETTESSEPIIMLVNQLIETAYTMGASDIHVEPWEHEVIIRYRIDGDLRIVNRLRPQKLINPIIARLKIMSNLDIAERRMPQDGRVVFKKYTRKNYDFDLRVATSPMNFGEKVVLRILDKNRSTLPLQQLGFSDRHLKIYRDKIFTPYGMILHVGPTGSGKSMTLYAALNEVQRPELNIQTAEDPIEYTLQGINQMQMHREIGLTFQRALRSYLRQDPDVLLVGEIRDLETAQIAVEAALTGHLLLTTLHTNDASATMTRLVEMGIEPFLVSSSIILVCAQRLLRRLCSECKEPYKAPPDEKLLLGLPSDYNITLYRSKGCKDCNGVGYRGRIGTHEILVPDDEMRRTISMKGITSEQIKRDAVERCGMTTLWWDAMEKVRQGIDSIQDVVSKIRKDEFDSRPDWMFEEMGLKRPTNRDKPLF